MPWIANKTLDRLEARVTVLEAERQQLLDRLLTMAGQPALYLPALYRPVAPAPVRDAPSAEPVREMRTDTAERPGTAERPTGRRVTIDEIEAAAMNAAANGDPSVSRMGLTGRAVKVA